MIATARLVARLIAVLVWTLFAMLVQAFLVLLPGRGKILFARFYWKGMARILGLRVTVIGRLGPQRPVLFVSNHSSWLDIVALGAVLPACFVAKADIAGWPFFGWVAKLGRTIFVTRKRQGVGRERNVLAERLAAGENIILFPEGTTSDGARVLPFSSSFLALAETPAQPSVQAVTLVFDAVDAIPLTAGDRALLSWYGDMDLVPHYRRLGRYGKLHATLVLDEPFPPGHFPNRKALTATLETRIAATAAALRQQRYAPAARSDISCAP